MLLRAPTTVDLIARLAAELPDRVILSSDSSQLTCAELWQQVQALARALLETGVEPGERVAIRSSNRIEWSVWEYACHAAALVPVGIGMQWTDQHVGDVLADCDARVLVVENGAALRVLNPARLKRCRSICVLDAEPEDSRGPDWVAHRALLCSGMLHRGSLPSCGADDAAAIIYTSGSTGKPKAIMHTHARVMAAVHAIADFYPELEGGRLALSWMPMEHLFQRILNLVSCAFALETKVLRDPNTVIAEVVASRPSYFAGVPFVYEQLLRAIESSPASFAAWQRELRLMIVGAAPSLLVMLERFTALGYPIRQAYSTSECIVPIAANTARDNRVGSVGRPHPGYDFRISSEGEIQVRGTGVFDGYLGAETREETRTRELFAPDGYFRTGDYGHLDGDGYLYVTGRAEDFFKTSTGRRISPFEVESAYKRSEWVEHIVVVGHARKHLVALVQLRPACMLSLATRFGLAHLTAEQLCLERCVTTAVLEELRLHEVGLEPYKRVRAALLLARPLSVENGELTPTLKLRRDVIVKRCTPVLEALFGHPESEADGKHAA